MVQYEKLTHCRGCDKSFVDIFRHWGWHPTCKAACSAGAGAGSPVDLEAGLEARTAIFQDRVQQQITEELGRMRYESMAGGSNINSLKKSMAAWLSDTKAALISELQPYISPRSGINVSDLVTSHLSWFNGIESERLETNLYRELLGRSLVEPVRRVLGRHKETVKDAEGVEYSSKEVEDVCFDFPLVQQIQALIEHDPAAWAQIQRASHEWSDDTRNEPHVIADIPQGKIFTEHAKLGLQSGEILCPVHGGRRTKLAFKAYYDEIEPANPLGFARGVHNIGCTYVSVLNLDADVRNRMEYTLIVSLVLNSDVKRYGPVKVFGGAEIDETKSVYEKLDHAPSSLGAQMRAFDKGVELSVPSSSGGYEQCYFHGWMIVFCADFPAAGKLLPTAQSTGAAKPCRGCDWLRTSQQAFKPTSLLSDRKCKWKIRSFAQVAQ